MGLSVWQPGAGSEGVFVVDDAVFGERVLVAGVGPDRVRLVAVVDDQSAVVAVDAGLDAVRWCEHRRQDVEGVGQLLAPAAGEDVVGVGQAGAGVAGRRVASLVGVAGGEPGRRCGVLIRDPPGPVVAVTNPIRWYAWVVGADRLIVLLRRRRPVDDREVMVQPAVGVDGPPLSPGQPTIERLRELDVELAVSVVLPGGVEVVVLRVLLGDPRVVVGADERPGDAFLRSTAGVAPRGTGVGVGTDPGRGGAVQPAGAQLGLAGRGAVHTELLAKSCRRRTRLTRLGIIGRTLTA